MYLLYDNDPSCLSQASSLTQSFLFHHCATFDAISVVVALHFFKSSESVFPNTRSHIYDAVISVIPGLKSTYDGLATTPVCMTLT